MTAMMIILTDYQNCKFKDFGIELVSIIIDNSTAKIYIYHIIYIDNAKSFLIHHQNDDYKLSDMVEQKEASFCQQPLQKKQMQTFKVKETAKRGRKENTLKKMNIFSPSRISVFFLKQMRLQGIKFKLEQFHRKEENIRSEKCCLVR